MKFNQIIAVLFVICLVVGIILSFIYAVAPKESNGDIKQSEKEKYTIIGWVSLSLILTGAIGILVMYAYNNKEKINEYVSKWKSKSQEDITL